MIKTLPQSLLEQSKKMFEQQLYESIMLTEDRIQFLKANMPDVSTDHDALATHTNHADIIDHFAEHGDPTKNKRYTQWIMNRYKDKDFRQEDAPRIHDALSLFEKHKAKLDKKDINSYKSISDLSTAVAPHREAPATKAEAKAESIEKGRTLIHDDGATKVYRLEQGKHGKAASQAIYGGGSDLGGTHTDWCTAARSEHCMYDHYTKYKPLYVIHGKDGSVYQAHPDTLQFMDSRDRPVDQDTPEDVKNALNHIPDGHHLKISHDLGATADEVADAYTNGHMTVLKTKAIKHPNAPAHILRHAANSEDGNMRVSVAKHQNTPNDVIETLMNDKAALVRVAVASNTSATADQLDRLYANHPHTRHQVATNPNTGDYTIGKMIDKGEAVHAIAARSNMSNGLLSKIADTIPELMSSVAHEGNEIPNSLFHHTLHRLSLDATKKYDRDYLLRVASKNKNGDASMVSEMMQKNNPSERVNALSSPHVTQEHIKAGLFDDRDFMVKDAASKHKGLTFETAKFFTDNDHTPLNNGLVYNNFRKHPVIGKQISEYLDQKGIK